MFTCMICKKQFSQITGKHLKTHGIDTVADYKAMYPSAETVSRRKDSQETREKKRIARTGKTHTQEAKDKIGAKHLGKTRSAEEINKWRVSYAQFIEEHGSPMLGKDRGEEFKKKMSDIAKARPPEQVKEKVEQMWAARRGSKATPKQRERYSLARIAYIEENPDKLPNKLFNTKPEQEFASILDNLGISYKKNVRIGNRLYDFQINNNVLVEIDGPYHWNYKMYGNRNMPDDERKMLFAEAKKRDMYKDQLATDNGYILYRIKVEGSIPKDWNSQLQAQGCKLF